jgi:hypothetical protein
LNLTGKVITSILVSSDHPFANPVGRRLTPKQSPPIARVDSLTTIHTRVLWGIVREAVALLLPIQVSHL